MKILLTNDDGINAVGIEALKKALLKEGHKLIIVAPKENQSGCSHTMNFYKYIYLTKEYEDENLVEYSLSGSPADCVKIATSQLCMDIDLVISGVNNLPNSGTDLIYSGTFNGAYEGTVCGIDSISISAMDEKYIDSAVEFLVKNLQILKDNFFSSKTPYTININVPNYLDKVKGVEICPIGEKKYTDEYIINPTNDPNTYEYYLFGDEIDIKSNTGGCDVNMLNNGYITITPTVVTFTYSYEYINKLKDIKLL